MISGFLRFFGRVLFIACVLNEAGHAAETRDWIVLAAPELRPALETLAAHRKAEGYRVTVLDSALALDPAKAVTTIKIIAGDQPGPVFVVLAGTANEHAPAKVRVAATRGTQGRMKALFSDHGYGISRADSVPRAAVGRLPARSAEEARQMIAKILAFENPGGQAAWRTRVTTLVGHPGGNSALEKSFAAGYINTAVGARLSLLHPRWRPHVATDVPGSPWLLEKKRLEEDFLREVSAGSFFSVELLGDPAMRLPVIPASIKLAVPEHIAPGGLLSVSGELPVAFAGAAVRITLERPPGRTARGADHAQANDPVVHTMEATQKDSHFSVTIPVAAEYSEDSIVLPAIVENKGAAAIGVRLIKIEKR